MKWKFTLYPFLIRFARTALAAIISFSYRRTDITRACLALYYNHYRCQVERKTIHFYQRYISLQICLTNENTHLHYTNFTFLPYMCQIWRKRPSPRVVFYGNLRWLGDTLWCCYVRHASVCPRQTCIFSKRDPVHGRRRDLDLTSEILSSHECHLVYKHSKPSSTNPVAMGSNGRNLITSEQSLLFTGTVRLSCLSKSLIHSIRVELEDRRFRFGLAQMWCCFQLNHRLQRRHTERIIEFARNSSNWCD